MTETVAPPSTTPPLVQTPYVGLVPFSEGDAAYFFGRERERAIVAANLRAARLTLLYGASGVGKSSLLLAGVVHDIRETVAMNLADRLPGERAPVGVCVVRSWRDDPVATVLEAIRVSAVEALGGEALEPWTAGTSTVEAVSSWLQRVRRLLVVLDQFEDYFLYHADEDGDGTFAFELPRLVNAPALRLNVLISIREDALAKLDRFKGRIPHLFANYLRIDYLDREAARRALENPIGELNRRLPAGAEPYLIEPALVEAVLDAAGSGRLALTELGAGAVEASAKSSSIETPFLQLVMERLWRATVQAGSRELTLATLNALGGAEQIVDAHLLEAMAALQPDEQEIAAEAFRYLVTRSRTKIAHQASDLAEWTGRPESEVVAVLEKLSHGESGRILRPLPPPPGREEKRYEIFHDVLAEPILDWRTQHEREREKAELASRLEAQQAEQREAARKKLSRIRWAALALLVVIAALTGLAVWALQQRATATRERNVGRSRELAARALNQIEIDPAAGVRLAAKAARVRPTDEARDALRAALAESHVRAVLGAHIGPVLSASFSPDSRLVVTAEGKTARVWDADRRATVAVLRGHTGLVLSAAFSPDGRLVVTASDDGTARIWDTSSWTLLAVLHGRCRAPGECLPVREATFSPDGKLVALVSEVAYAYRLKNGSPHLLTVLHVPVNSIGFSSDGTRVVTAGDEGTHVWNAATGRSLAVLGTGAASTASFSPDGKRVVTASTDGARVWEASSGRLVKELTPSAVVAAAFSPDGLRVVTASADGTARIWYASSSGSLDLVGHEGPVASAAFGPDGSLVVTAGDDGTARIWDASSGNVLAVLRGHTGHVLAASFSRDGKSVVTASPDGTARVWDVPSQGTFTALRGGAGPVASASFSRDGMRVLTASADGTARVWDASTGHRIAVLRAHDGSLSTAVFSTDGKRVLTAGLSGTGSVWDSSTGRLVAVLRGHKGPISAASFGSDGRRVVTASWDRTARVWDASTGRTIAVLRGHKGAVSAVSFSPDGKLVATGSDDGTARLWDAADGSPTDVLFMDAAVLDVGFRPDGKQLVTASEGGTAIILPIESGSGPRAVLSGHTGSVLTARFSSDGKLVVTAGIDGTGRVWDASSGEVVAVLRGHSGQIRSAGFSPDGSLVVTAGDHHDATVRIWETANGRSLAVLRGDTAASFSPDGRRVVTASADGTARIYTCDLCGSLDELLALADRVPTTR